MASEHFTFTLPRLKALKPRDKAYMVHDDNVIGLQCKVTPAGKKVFIVRRRPKGNRKVITVTLGNLGDGLPIKQVRDYAIDVIGQFNRGINPNIERKADAVEVELASITLEQAFDSYLSGARNRNTGKPLGERVQRRYPRVFKRDFKEWLNRPLVSIKPLALVNLYDHVESAHGRVSAAKLMSIFGAVWNFNNKLHKTESNIEPFGKCPIWKLADLRPRWDKTTPRTHKVSVDDLPVWLAAIRTEESPASLFFEALLITGARRNEIAGLRWDQVDMKHKAITFLNTKNGTDHVLPITSRMEQLLLESHRNHPHLTKPFRCLNPHPIITRVVDATGIKFSSHAIRRTFAMLADKSGAGAFAIKAILNHSPGADVTQGHYVQYTDLNDLREPLQEIEDYILSIGYGHRNNVLQVVK